MDFPTPEQLLSARVNEFTKSINMLLKERHSLSALIVLYAAIDTFASLQRPETEADTSDAHYKRWVEDYMIAGTPRTYTKDDLWSARCGLLHTHTASSRLSRGGKAKQLHYYKTQGLVPPATQRAFDSLVAKGKLMVNVDALVTDFIEGTRRFLDAIERDPVLKRKVSHHSAALLSFWANSPESL